MVTRYVIRLYLFGVILAAGFAMLLWRLWVVQIEDHKKYLAQVPQAALAVQRIPGIRGEITDRHGIPLATNKVSYEIKLDLRDIERRYRKFNKEVPKYQHPFNDKFGTRRFREESDIFVMYQTEIEPQLEQLGLATDLNAKEMRLHYRTNRGVIPFTYRKDVSFQDIALVAEQSQFLEGVSISKRTLRHYPYGALLGHVLGYVKQSGELDIPHDDRGKFDFYEGEEEGIAGIEQTMDRALRARPGQRVFPKNEHRKIVHEELIDRRIEPVKGHDVSLTIDLDIQMIAELALREAKVGRGAAVVINPQNGDVLALVSVPSYDPNKFIPEIDAEDWKAYKGDKSLPLLNRAISAYAPGSIYKIPVALAGCVRGQSRRLFPCNGGMQFGGHFARCTGRHGTLQLSDAIMRSCNGFFYRYGIQTGIKDIDTIGDWFNLGEPTGIELPREDGGILPRPDVFASGGWRDAETAFTAIGQGQVLATPLQMCAVTAAVANGRFAYRPKLVKHTFDHAEALEIPLKPRIQKDFAEADGIPSADMELVRKGMWKVVHGDGGTARSIRTKDYEIGGKTGTAQAWLEGRPRDDKHKDYKTWFIAFAPYDLPKFAVSVFVENGTSGGGTSAPIAARILKQAIAHENGTYNPPRQPLAEAIGHFDRLERTVYEDDPVDAALLAAAAASEEDLVADAAPPVTRRAAGPPRKRPAAAAPKIRKAPDAEGRRTRRAPKKPPAATTPPAAPAAAATAAPPSRTLMDRLTKRGQTP